MRRIVRTIHEKKYLYFSYHDWSKHRTVNDYCGFPDDPNSLLKACTIELREIDNTKKSLTVRAKEIRSEMRKFKKKWSPKHTKRLHCRYYIEVNPFNLIPLKKWANKSNIKHNVILEPFAGANKYNHYVETRRSM